MNLYRTQNSFILTKPPKTQFRMLFGSGSALELVDAGEKNKTQSLWLQQQQRACVQTFTYMRKLIKKTCQNGWKSLNFFMT